MDSLQQIALGNLIAAVAADGNHKKLIDNTLQAFYGPKITGIYHDTLSEAIEAAENELEIKGAKLIFPEDRYMPALAIGETGQEHFVIDSLNGKPTRKWGHVSIYRLESGRYEQTNYIL